MVRSRVFCSWNLPPKRNLNYWEVEQMGILLEMLDQYCLGDREVEDEQLWTYDSEQGFSVKSMYLASLTPASDPFPNKFIWNHLVSSKVSFLLWELWRDKAPTIDNLIRRGLIMPNWCCSYKADGDSSRHLFVHCPIATALWNYMVYIQSPVDVAGFSQKPL